MTGIYSTIKCMPTFSYQSLRPKPYWFPHFITVNLVLASRLLDALCSPQLTSLQHHGNLKSVVLEPGCLLLPPTSSLTPGQFLHSSVWVLGSLVLLVMLGKVLGLSWPKAASVSIHFSSYPFTLTFASALPVSTQNLCFSSWNLYGFFFFFLSIMSEGTWLVQSKTQCYSQHLQVQMSLSVTLQPLSVFLEKIQSLQNQNI